jgi:hypothetical protein
MLTQAQGSLKGETPRHAGAGWGTLRGSSLRLFLLEHGAIAFVRVNHAHQLGHIR